MPFTPAQHALANAQQWNAAQDHAPRVRLVAGPGTGKSATIERRVAHVLNGGADAQRVHVISFTRATCAELSQRIAAFCAAQPCAAVADEVRVYTMHSLALRILRQAAVLTTLYPADPVVLDDWERSAVYDLELASELDCSPGRAAAVRLAHDAEWHTLNPQAIAQAAITPVEQEGFDAFHTTRRNLYSCVLPGEVIYECVVRIRHGDIQPHQLPPIDHLIVDEYQDLNACDQEFVRLLANMGAQLFIVGDDDQSIYAFRHANPSGIVDFTNLYPGTGSHELTQCFRCTPTILDPALRLIALNPNRLPKNIISAYLASDPPVSGILHVWSFASADEEATAIAQSCRAMVTAGMVGQEDQIVILISNRRLQLPAITRELANLGLPFDPPAGEAVRDDEAIRAAYSILRLVRDHATNTPDYVAHRALLAQLHGVGVATTKAVGTLCVANHQNFRDLFDVATLPNWLTNRAAAAVERIRTGIQQTQGWALDETVGLRANDIADLLRHVVFSGAARAGDLAAIWTAFSAGLPQGMTLDELLAFLSADDEAEQRQILDNVRQRLGEIAHPGVEEQRRIRILTMHGAKGLSGKIVFIPSAEQGIMPSLRAIHAAGLLNEHRRLFYVSVTRAKAACVISHAALHTGAAAFLIQQRPRVSLTRSQFLNEMALISMNRTDGLTAAEANEIMAHVNNL